jgi:glycosyltransferase involved in cell wall biosynthesis
MRILLVTRLFPLPTNSARGNFVADHVSLLRGLGHEVKVVNPLPRMFRYQEARRSTLEGVAKTPRNFTYEHAEVQVCKHLQLPNWPSITAWRVAALKVDLADWLPEVVISHTLWPVAILAKRLAITYAVPLIGVIHGYDFSVGLNNPLLGKRIEKIALSCDHLVVVSPQLEKFSAKAIPCHVAVGEEWLNPLRKWRGSWRNQSLNLLFPADPRRPEKNHVLCLKTGAELEERGWQVNLTVMKKQPRSIVWDRMSTTDICIITSTRESGPLVAREAIACGSPVAAVDVGDLASWLPEVFAAEPSALADGIESILRNGQKITLPERFSIQSVASQWSELLESL